MNRIGFALIILLFAVFSSCKKQIPQLPSNKIEVDNSEAIALLDINQNLTVKEDSLLEVFAKKQNKTYVKHELGFWYAIEQAGTGKKVNGKATCNFSYELTLLNGDKIEVGRKQITIGKKQVVPGLEEGIKLLHYGDSATFIIPWYLGYGMKGNKPKVLPYTSVIYSIRLNN